MRQQNLVGADVSSHFGSSLSLLTRDRRVTLLFVRRRSSVMVREGWTKVQVIRGKRPPSCSGHVQDLSSMFVRGSQQGVEKLAKDKFAASQPPECAPGSIEGSSKREDPEDWELFSQRTKSVHGSSWSKARWNMAHSKGALRGHSQRQGSGAQQLSTLPMRMGGLGLRSAELLAPAAFWASWVVRRLDANEHYPGCVAELREACVALDKKGFWWRPSWPQLREGKDHHKHAHEILVSGLTVGSTGHLPSSTLVIGRCHFCQLISCLPSSSPATMQGWHWRTPPLLVSSPYFHTFSVCCSWRGVCRCC